MTNILFALLVATNLSTTPAGDAVKKAPEAVEAPAEQAEAKAEAPAAEPETAEGVAEETRKVDFHTSKTICGEFTKDDNANTQQLMQEGEVYLRLGQFLSARQNFCAAYFHGPDDMVVLEKLRRTLISLGDTTELTEITAKLAHLYATSPNPYAMQRANSRLDELITLAPDHAGRHAVDVALGRVKRESDGDDLHLFDRFRSFIGIFVILGLALLMSNNRKRINYRIVSWGLGLQLFFAVIILWTPPGRYIFDAARRVIAKILAFTDDGGEFLFGSIYRGVYPKGAFGPIQVTDGVTGDMVAVGHIFVFHVLPTIVFFGALMAVFYHLGIIQKIVEGIAWVMTRTLGTSGA
ncbi:hypothetical protein KAI87_12565, partial [Myxococcota bacterium]|nr:hypothetical protein [Myxococcota bacterium]